MAEIWSITFQETRTQVDELGRTIRSLDSLGTPGLHLYDSFSGELRVFPQGPGAEAWVSKLSSEDSAADFQTLKEDLRREFSKVRTFLTDGGARPLEKAKILKKLEEIRLSFDASDRFFRDFFKHADKKLIALGRSIQMQILSALSALPILAQEDDAFLQFEVNNAVDAFIHRSEDEEFEPFLFGRLDKLIGKLRPQAAKRVFQFAAEAWGEVAIHRLFIDWRTDSIEKKQACEAVWQTLKDQLPSLELSEKEAKAVAERAFERVVASRERTKAQVDDYAQMRKAG